jgi:type IV secretion system protein VirD4
LSRLSPAATVILYFPGDNLTKDSASSGNAGGKPVRNPEREKPQWEDTITNRMLHWSYILEQKEEL